MVSGSGASESDYGCSATSCPQCGKSVYFVRPYRVGAVWFDELGPPWPKHGCFNDDGNETDGDVGPSIRSIMSFLELIAAPPLSGARDPNVHILRLPGRGDAFHDLDLQGVDLSGLDLQEVAFVLCDLTGRLDVLSADQ